jgi:hypothetical protein
LHEQNRSRFRVPVEIPSGITLLDRTIRTYEAGTLNIEQLKPTPLFFESPQECVRELSSV